METVKTIKGLEKSLLVAGIATLLVTTGCASTSGSAAAEEVAPSTSATKAPTASPTEASAPSTVYEPTKSDLFGTPLYAGWEAVKAGEPVRVTGGTYAPGEAVRIQGFQIMPMPSYDAANDMYHQVGEQIPLTEELTVTADENGEFDTALPIPAGVTPQEVDIISQRPDGGANLVRITVE